MTIGLVSCVKTKLKVPAKAKDLYISSLFKKSRRWAECNCDEWFVLSAQYGLVDPEQSAKPYELTMKSFPIADRKRWARKVYKTMDNVGLLKPDSKFIWLAGLDYSHELSLLLSGYPQHHPLKGLRMGKRLKWLGKQLEHCEV